MDLAAKHNTPTEKHVPDDAFRFGPRELGVGPDGKRLPRADTVYAACRRLDELGWHWDPELQCRVKDGQPLSVEIIASLDDVVLLTEACRAARPFPAMG